METAEPWWRQGMHNRRIAWFGFFIVVFVVALVIGNFAWAGLALATSGTFLVQKGVNRFQLGPTTLDNVGRALVLVGIVVFLAAVARAISSV